MTRIEFPDSAFMHITMSGKHKLKGARKLCTNTFTHSRTIWVYCYYYVC